jgi:hypothetical protein
MRIGKASIITLAAAALLGQTNPGVTEWQAMAECRLDRDAANAARKPLPVIRRAPDSLGEPGTMLIDYETRTLRSLGGSVTKFSVSDPGPGPNSDRVGLEFELSVPYAAAEAALLRAHGISACSNQYIDEGLRLCEFDPPGRDMGVKLSQARDGAKMADGSSSWSRVRLTCSY